MTVRQDLMSAVKAAKSAVLDNLDMAKIRTGNSNPFGDKTLVLDQSAEDSAIAVLESSDISYMILTEEKGLIQARKRPEYLVVMDPIDGSTNLERGIPLCSVGISAIPYSDTMTTDDIELSIIESFFTKEFYVAEKGKGVSLNGTPIKAAKEVNHEDAIISYDTKKPMRDDFGESSLRTLDYVYDMRRTGSNLLDLCWTASGALDAMIDLRGVLPIVHASGTHMVFEAGGFVIDRSGNRFKQDFDMNKRMSFVAASNETLARGLLHAFNGHE